jgi:multidrug efflux system outer membrane protein
MNASPMKSSVVTLLSCLLLASCALGPDYQRPEVALPARFADEPVNPATATTPPATNTPANGTAAPAAIQPDWWTLYGDAVLNGLVAEALRNNADIKIAAAQVEEAEALLRQADASLIPEIDLGASGSRSRVSRATALPNVPPLLRDDRRVALSTSFEIDFWGKFRRGSEAARAQALASVYGREVVALTLVGSTVQAYFSLRSLDAQIAASRSSLVTRQESLDVARDRAVAGLSSDLDVNLAEGARADLAAQLKELERQRSVVEHQLALLTMRAGLQLPAGDLQTLPMPPVPPAGLPSALLDRRPDVRAAEQSLVAANAQIGIAKAALFPTLSLTGSLGGQSAALSNLLNSGARIWSAGFGLALPVFDAGRNLARLDQVKSRQQQSLFGYQRTVAVAFREVADAISNLHQATISETDLQARVMAARNSLELARARYESGYSAYIDVLDAQRTANDAELALIRNRQSRLSYSVDFMKALGGGWDASIPAAR